MPIYCTRATAERLEEGREAFGHPCERLLEWMNPMIVVSCSLGVRASAQALIMGTLRREIRTGIPAGGHPTRYGACLLSGSISLTVRDYC